MKRNSFIELAEQSRLVLMRETGMDDLDYHLMILEGGCAYLEELVQPRGASSPSPELHQLYREHLTAIGYWAFYEFLFRHLEIGVASDWMREGALEPLQTTDWKRQRLLAEVQALHTNRMANNLLDAWLKELGPKRTLRIPSKPQPAHEHVH